KSSGSTAYCTKSVVKAGTVKGALFLPGTADGGRQRHASEGAARKGAHMSQKPPTRAMREKPDLDQLKRQAKELLEAYRASSPEALAEVTMSIDSLRGPVADLATSVGALAGLTAEGR